MLKVNVSATQGSGLVNEDAAGYCGDAVWVIDGATGVGEPVLHGVSDAAWFANRVNVVLGDILRDRPAIATRDLLMETISTCAAAFECAARRRVTDRADLPSAACAIVRQIGDAVELTTLGDCRVAYRAADGSPRLFGGTALGPFEGRSIALAEELRRANPTISCSNRRCSRICERRDG